MEKSWNRGELPQERPVVQNYSDNASITKKKEKTTTKTKKTVLTQNALSHLLPKESRCPRLMGNCSVDL